MKGGAIRGPCCVDYALFTEDKPLIARPPPPAPTAAAAAAAKEKAPTLPDTRNETSSF